MKIMVGLTGASGIAYGVRLIEIMSEKKIDVFSSITPAAKEILRHETKYTVEYIKGMSKYYESNDFSAPFVSGSARIDACVIIPASMKTVSAIANGFTDNIITRCADVVLKEGKKLIVVPRETPLNMIHLRNLLILSKNNVTVLPAMPAFYQKPKSVEDFIDFIVGKVLDNLGIENDLYERWGQI
ncbi:MAG: UbiX family flavin prenyltransferase [Candidatus Hydrothermarchaeota archaeon]